MEERGACHAVSGHAARPPSHPPRDPGNREAGVGGVYVALLSSARSQLFDRKSSAARLKSPFHRCSSLLGSIQHSGPPAQMSACLRCSTEWWMGEQWKVAASACPSRLVCRVGASGAIECSVCPPAVQPAVVQAPRQAVRARRSHARVSLHARGQVQLRTSKQVRGARGCLLAGRPPATWLPWQLCCNTMYRV